MDNRVVCSFNGILEHDIDMILMQLLSIDEQFVSFIGSRTEITTDMFSISSIEISKSDADLGESDLEVELISDEIRIRLLIEDKIDAIAMPRQPERYIERGEKYIADRTCDDYRAMIVCPQKYYIHDAAAKRYPYHMFYEEIVEYLRNKPEPIYQVYRQVFEEAISRAKKPPKVTLNESANAFLRKYIDFQRTNYPQLDLRTKPESNGYWAQYATTLENTYLHHKIEEGRIDLTFNKAASKTTDLQQVADWLRNHNMPSVRAVNISKSGALQITVPKLDMKQQFENADLEDLRICFESISELVKFADMVSLTNKIGRK